jgi:hypothetical protein
MMGVLAVAFVMLPRFVSRHRVVKRASPAQMCASGGVSETGPLGRAYAQKFVDSVFNVGFFLPMLSKSVLKAAANRPKHEISSAAQENISPTAFAITKQWRSVRTERMKSIQSVQNCVIPSWSVVAYLQKM